MRLRVRPFYTEYAWDPPRREPSDDEDSSGVAGLRAALRGSAAQCTRDDGEIISAGDVQTPGIPWQIFRDRPPLRNYLLNRRAIVTTSRRQKLLLRFIVPLAICASISLWPAIPQERAIGERLSIVLPAAAQAPVTLDRSIRDYKLPSEIPWVERNGTGSVTLYGDASKPGGIYVSLLRRPFGNWSAPHTHPTERYVTVLEGTFLAGTGPVQDRNRVDALKAGTVVSEVPTRMHYDGVGQDGVTLFFIGMGGTNSGPASEPPRAPGGPNVDPTARIAKKQEDMVWTRAADGSTFVNVFGDPGKAGLYVQFVRRPPNSWSTAHRHPNDQFLWVMGGRMYLGTGSSVDKDKTVGMPKGSYIHDFANGTHYEGTKDEDLWLLVAGMGPAAPERASD
jgi:hypothetical protein